MDMDFFNLTPEVQMDLLNMMILMDNNDLSEFPAQQSSPPPPPPPSYQLPPPPTLNIPTHQVLPFSTVDPTRAAVAAMREEIFRMAAMQPVEIDPESVRPPKKRRNVRISKDPQSVAARQRRERIRERIRILQQLVPGGSKMDTASMLDEAIHYVKFLKMQVQSLERAHMHIAANNMININSNGNYNYYS